MLAYKYQKLLRAVTVSKDLVIQSESQAKLEQIVMKVKAESNFDAINNLALLISLGGKYPSMRLINAKKGVILPENTLSGFDLNVFVSNVLPTLLSRTMDKITAVSYGSTSNKLTFSFKATDSMSWYMRKIWKTLDTEVGNYEYELTFVTSSFNSYENESLFRSLQIPVVIS